MKATQLIEQLQKLVVEHGDLELHADTCFSARSTTIEGVEYQGGMIPPFFDVILE